MALFDCVFIARQDISAVQVEALADQFETVIKDNGGSVPKREVWGLRSLAYKIKKNRKGHYVLMNIISPAPALHEMERQMRINEDILRYMTVSVDEHEEGPSIVMQSRNKDEDSADTINRENKEPDKGGLGDTKVDIQDTADTNEINEVLEQ